MDNQDIRSLNAELAQLRAENQRLRALLGKANQPRAEFEEILHRLMDGVLILDPASLEIIYANQGAERLYGVPPGSLTGKTAADLAGNFTLAEIREYIRELTSGRQAYLNISSMERRADGSLFPGHLYLQLIAPGGGSPRLVVTLREMTRPSPHDQAELTLWAHVFQHANWGVLLCRGGGMTIERVNPTFARERGYTVEELEGRPLSLLFPEDFHGCIPEQVALIESKGHHTLEAVHKRKDGSLFPVWISATTVRDENGRVVYRVSNVQDLTERKRLENELRDALEWQQAIFHNSSVGIVVVNQYRIIHDVNARFLEIFGYREEEVLGQSAAMLHRDPNAFADFGLNVYQRTCEGDVRRVEYPFRHKSGRVFWCDISGRAIDPSDLSKGVVWVLIDVSRRKQSEAEYQAVVGAMREGVVVHGTDGRIIAHNPVAGEILGLSEDQLLGRDSLDPVWHTVHENGEPFPGDRHPVMLTLADGQPRNNVVMGIHRHENDIRWISINSQVLGEGGEIAKVIVTFRDITEERLALDRLRESEAHYRAIFDYAPVGIVWSQPAGRIDESNASARRMLGYSREELRQLSWEQLTYPEGREQIRVLCKQLLDGERDSFTLETRYQHKNGHFIWCASSVSAIRGESGEVSSIISISQDITEMKQVERQLANARDQAEAANRAKSAFLANMSHELRTPLNAILGFAQILARDPLLDAKYLREVESIRRGGEYLLTLISDILDLAKIEAGRFELLPRAWKTEGLFRSLTEMFRMRAESKGVQFHYLPADDLPETLYCDDRRLRQIAINLLGNAVKFTEQGEISLRVSYHEGRLKLGVEDTGQGIAPEELESIFQPFTQSGLARHREQGTGLGLSITRRLVEVMDGKLSVRSRLGLGSYFEAQLPVEAVSTLGEAQVNSFGSRITGYRRLDPSREALRILVVEDLPDNSEVLRRLLVPLGFELAVVESGEDCLELAPRFRPDLVLMDLRLPGIDGLETTRRLRRQPEFDDLPVIAVSASAFGEDRLNSLLAGCCEHIPKPLRFSKLLKQLAEHLPLEWEQAPEPPSEDAADSRRENRPLSRRDCQSLVEFVQIGDILSITQYLEKLSEAGQIGEDGLHLLQLARNFHIREIQEWLERRRTEDQ